jgi:adenosylcobinamide kinase / adenosylcobinamide-phosphate guanylyltransferase
MAEIILVTGGARSGKSSEALRLAEGFEQKIFIATAVAFDDEMRARISRHQAERGPDWRTLEIPEDLAGAIRGVADSETVILVDCLTVWLGNLLYRDESTDENSPRCAELLAALRQSPAARVILVTNEVGLSIVPENRLARHFRDVAGRLNQRVAALADRVILVVCGQCLTIKPAAKTNAL